MEDLKLDICRSSSKWSKPPGNSDALNLGKGIFYSDNEYGIPLLQDNQFIPVDLLGYNESLRLKKGDENKTIHFYLDDYMFEPLWNRPSKTLSRITKVGKALTPDFSMFGEYPLALQLYNTYRSRWLGRYWQEHFVEVIPTVSWSNEESFDFCFKGIHKHSTVSLSTMSIGKDDLASFIKGYEEMLRQLEPKNLVLYGDKEVLDFSKHFDNVYKYDTFWGKKRKENMNKKLERGDNK